MPKTAFELERAVTDQVSKVVVGKAAQLRLITAAILADGHILLEDLPGVGKTTLVKCLSTALGCQSRRIQFTPDLLPSDVTGMNIFDRQTGQFRRLQGPVVTNLLLADELNRAIPRTQSALLEAMEEKQVTIDGQTEALPAPFVVLATQNPVESESTFRLPAAQMDRFLMCLSMGYPTPDEEIAMLRLVGDSIPYESVQAVTSPDELCTLQKQVQSVRVSDAVTAYIVAITEKTRKSPDLRLGASPRASKALYRAAKALAAVSGRDYVTPDDVQELAMPVLCHRLVLSADGAMAGKTPQAVLTALLEAVPVPPATEGLFDKNNG
jgi:MoxR-like ATPase